MEALSTKVMLITVFLCIYSALHLYFLVKSRRAFRLEGVWYIFWLVLLVFLLLAPVQSRLLYSIGYSMSGLILTWIGYLWMGFLCLFVCISIPIDGYHIIVSAIREVFNISWTGLVLLRRQSFYLAAGIATGLMIYGAIAAYQLDVEHITIKSSKIPVGHDGIRIVQISDLHLGPMLYPSRLDPLQSAIRTALPDILVCTGDLLDGDFHRQKDVARMLKALPAPLGKFAITGNHEDYAGLNDALAFLKEAGFQVLRDSSTIVTDTMAIVGLDDPSTRKSEPLSETELLAGIPADKFILLLKHRPLVEKAMLDHFDLQLSGHTHGGQIFPISLLIKLRYPMDKGLFSVGKISRLYVSRGTGTWGPPLRLFDLPELTVIDIVPAQPTKEPVTAE